VNGTGHTIQGAGRIGDASFSLVNEGNIIANQSAGLTITAGSLTNTGQISVTAGNTLAISFGTFANSAGAANGTILDNGGTLTLQSLGGGPSTFTGGKVNVINGGTLTASSSTVLSGVTLTIDSASSASINGGYVADGSTVTNHGTLTLNGATFIDNPSLDNYGTVNTGATSGTSTLSGTLTNQAGAVINVAAGSALELETGATFTNDGSLNVAAGSVFSISSGADFANYQGTTLTGGAYDIAGLFAFAGADIVTNQAAITLSGSGQVQDETSGDNGLRDFATNGSQGQFSLVGSASFQSGGDFTNSGTVTIDSGSIFSAGPTGTNNYIQSGGTTILDGTLQAGTVVLNGGSLSGTGTLAGNLTNAGSVEPGDAPGVLTIDGNYVQDGSGVLNIEIDSASLFDSLDISGSAQLDGTLNMILAGGFRPLVFEQFTIMNFGSRSGDFTVVNDPGNWLEIWGANSLTMEYVTPEPATWALLAFALAGLGWFRRRASLRG
jgi:hypothetical protein